MVFFVGRMIDVAVPDVPDSLKNRKLRIRYMAKQALTATNAHKDVKCDSLDPNNRKSPMQNVLQRQKEKATRADSRFINRIHSERMSMPAGGMGVTKKDVYGGGGRMRVSSSKSNMLMTRMSGNENVSPVGD